MKMLALILALLTTGFASAETKTPCHMTMYIQTVQGVPAGSVDSTANLFLYGLRTAVEQHRGCITGEMNKANLGLYVTTLKLGDSGQTRDSVIAVALAVPLNGVPVYIDDYVFVVRSSDSIEDRVNALLESIGETLDHHSLQGQ